MATRVTDVHAARRFLHSDRGDGYLSAGREAEQLNHVMRIT
jgi:hypothetical protein